ncbi:MAG: glycosyltransferase family 4 protein [Pseudomonadota bacterium]
MSSAGFEGSGENALPLTVLQLVPRLEEGGVERGAIEIAAAVTEAGGQALVASEGGRLEPALRRAGGRLVRLPMAGKGPLAILRNIARLREVLRDEAVSILHARSRAPAWAGFFAARAERVPFVTTYHGAYSEGLPGKRLYNSVMARGRPVIAISGFIADLIRRRHRVAPENIVTIPRGADPALFDPDRVGADRLAALFDAWGCDADPRPILLLPARLTRWKGHLWLLDAAAQLRDAQARAAPEFRIVCAGGDAQGEFAGEIRRRAERLGLARDVALVGPVADMPAALKLASAVVCPSLEPEAFGRAAVEAQAMRKPVIASDHGGARETVLPGETGWLVPPGNVAALADALSTALTLPEPDALRMGAAGRQRVVERYSVAAMQTATLALYRDLLAQR